ncbi:unnamed protein product [Thlaspi arvense]|uniref:Uncharacterized protein n=1 Tax=Thlaspi arvense TaxID=13288 RepID=A0AAU9RDJ5_THLAR|nr:unnamed protein product [Thlaspi arvense]
MKSVASIPANYVSILQLQERWVKERERKQKEKDLAESGVKQQANGQGWREKMKVVVEAVEPRMKLEKKGLGGGFRPNRLEKEPNCEEAEVSATVSNKDEDGGDSQQRKKRWGKKMKKKKNQDGSVEEESFKSESKACIPRESNLVKEESPRVYVAKGDKIVQNRERDSIAVESQFQDLWTEKRVGEEASDREVKGPARLNSGHSNYRNRKHDWSSTRVIRATGPTVWVKKGKIDGASESNGVLLKRKEGLGCVGVDIESW